MRLFFGIDIPWQTQLAIDNWRQSAFGITQRPVPADNYHLTLAFLGDVDAGAIETLEAMAMSLSARRFKLTLDATGCFIKPGILWLGLTQANAALNALAGQLQKSLSQLGYRLDKSEYVPHVTLWRKLNADDCLSKPLIPPAFSFPVESFTLFESCTAPGNKPMQKKSPGKRRKSKEPRQGRAYYRAINDSPLTPVLLGGRN